ncbi:MAG: amino acid ABC transporter permease [Bdellovibrio sp. CG12_big_fil_rev_8_21_14_0_65_39_13]|nr:MAG: amino acid ABC transporter permease [Bdellovibrio sp. CG12_big_fil_rev_8_21_14_0_65_39_13]
MKILFAFIISFACMAQEVKVGSKAFTEGYLLAEYLSQHLEMSHGTKVERKFGLGSTGIVVEAINNNEIDLYPEYTGTITKDILKSKKALSIEEINSELAPMGLMISQSLGFNNTYALAMDRTLAEKMGIQKLSQLSQFRKLRFAFSHEFMGRSDGWEGLAKTYKLKGIRPESMQHNLAYEALKEKKVDVIEVYTTDAAIDRMDLTILKDDRSYFPSYLAVILARVEWVKAHPQLWELLKNLENKLDERKMTSLNSQVEIDKKTFADVISTFLGNNSTKTPVRNILWQKTLEHLVLVLIPLCFAIIIGIPLGFWSFHSPKASHFLVSLTGIFQTIPSLALLCFLIPLFGVGWKPALVALFLYSLLPIVLNTIGGLRAIPQSLHESATVLGLNGREKTLKIDLPLAYPSIMVGIQNALITGIGTATLAALIGAGGYGQLIVTGLAVNDISKIIQGAWPAAAMALVFQIFFSLIHKIKK